MSKRITFYKKRSSQICRIRILWATILTSHYYGDENENEIDIIIFGKMIVGDMMARRLILNSNCEGIHAEKRK